MIGCDLFTHFRSTGSMNRLNILENLCAGEESRTVNDAALDYMRRMKLSKKVISCPASTEFLFIDSLKLNDSIPPC